MFCCYLGLRYTVKFCLFSVGISLMTRSVPDTSLQSYHPVKMKLRSSPVFLYFWIQIFVKENTKRSQRKAYFQFQTKRLCCPVVKQVFHRFKGLQTPPFFSYFMRINVKKVFKILIVLSFLCISLMILIRYIIFY